MAYSDARAKELQSIGDRLFSTRSSLESLWQEIAENFYPERADFTTPRHLGEEFADHLMDSYPVRARRDLGNAFSSMLRPRARDWFHARAADERLMESQAVKSWLEMVTKTTKRFLYDPRAQFVRATKEGDMDFATFGNCGLSIEERRDRTGLLFRCWHLRDVAWCEDEEGVIDTVHRRLKMSARGILRRYPGKAAAAVKDCVTQDPYKEFQLRHIVLPVDECDSSKKPPANAEFVSIMLDADNCVVLEERFLPEFGYVIPRWQTISGSQYAFSPATIVGLPDARLIQAIALVILEAGQKAVDPPTVATTEAIRSDVQLFAGGTTWVDAAYDERLGEALRVLDLGKNIGVGGDLLTMIREAIADGHYLNKLMLPPVEGDMTAYEVQKRIEEYIRQALPLFEPVEQEYNGALLDTTARMLLRLGAYGRPEEMPEELRGQGMEWRFESPLQEASERQKVTTYQDVANITAIGAQVDPTVVKNIDTHRSYRDAVSATGAPADWLKPEEQVAEEAAAEEQAAQMMQMAQAANIGAETVANVAGADMAVQQAAAGPQQQQAA